MSLQDHEADLYAREAAMADDFAAFIREERAILDRERLALHHQPLAVVDPADLALASALRAARDPEVVIDPGYVPFPRRVLGWIARQMGA